MTTTLFFSFSNYMCTTLIFPFTKYVFLKLHPCHLYSDELLFLILWRWEQGQLWIWQTSTPLNPWQLFSFFYTSPWHLFISATESILVAEVCCGEHHTLNICQLFLNSMSVIYKTYERTNCLILLMNFKMDGLWLKTYFCLCLNIFIYRNN